MSLDCTCQDWIENIEKLNAPLRLQTIRSGFTWQYDGKKFRYCPWCGKELSTESWNEANGPTVSGSQ